MNALPSVLCAHGVRPLPHLKNVRSLERLAKALKKLRSETEETSQRIWLLSNKKQVSCSCDFKIEGSARKSM